MTRLRVPIWPIVIAVALLPAAVAAQAPPAVSPVEGMPFRFGSLGLAPSIAITDAGVDDNVFNDSRDPKRDYTITFVPRLLARFQLSRLLFTYDSNSQLVYYHEFASERSANAATDVRLDANLGRLQPHVTAGWLSSEQRLNQEIDVRAPRTQRTLAGGVKLLVAPRTSLLFNARRQDIDFEDQVFFRGVELAETMDMRTDLADAGMQLALTPLTTFGVTAGIQRDRFDRSPDRNSDTFRVMPGFLFDPSSLLRGSIAVGYRRFTPADPETPHYSGVVVQGSLSYTLLGRTRFDLSLSRDVQYSYEEIEPYYLGQGGRLVATHQLIGILDVQGVAGRQVMSYRASGVEGETRRDHADMFGAGIGFRMREHARFSVNWESSRRRSDLGTREYRRQRLYASLTLGVQS